MMDESGEKSLGRNSFIVMFFTLASRLLGILRIRIFGSIFGAGATADAINFSFNIPNNFRKLFSEGALSSA
ncbi:MAG: lipid II flippase MurJ, partial [Sphaerochaetaceae bacterium]|nr:lipid II flippase MurJ [Sphaerochaetaceae bacterium]